ncbi:GntR family transcriptional regulator [Streptomyces ipomoeae]|jgi:DNA-binding GntR family transcriptional regulator|uniref:GntR family transcriptional regulator n=1 Tax=Streptomyces ipomoeae TaxID=103232 RepID=A0AAE8VXB3_9ACTN|nr:GntR family transcriptional regulator [Streptomyces ipomoeae]MDX2693865.1 GntR family transcriptional regulator [Streptomyces ipomoeae]MDX2823497.1 GntR family transcriptional regulator [Streptomyces ipomoeae]MDX2837702.1 GntR family transcriptional regulator [Streptomyces ipomoeae]MDX2873452.1 GntR family transcriptional regulator [Streptomyces ipomoeae]TQE23922.1 GntR family transcriptional regulator [Streptomyces ipomoeae]
MQQVTTEPVSEEPTLAERAYRAIRDRLVMLEIRPGAPINEEQLGQSLGVGRTPVREALKRLQYERLITTYPRRGTFATEVNITDLAHISEVRQELEPLAAAQAARRATATDRAKLTALRRELENADSGRQDATELMHLDLQVHRAIYAAAHNPYLEDALVRHDNLATRIWCLFIDRLSDMAGHVEEHGPLIDAIVAGEPEKAAQLARSHVEDFERAIRAAI